MKEDPVRDPGYCHLMQQQDVGRLQFYMTMLAVEVIAKICHLYLVIKEAGIGGAYGSALSYPIAQKLGFKSTCIGILLLFVLHYFCSENG